VALFFGVFVWLAYVAIEPIVRRRWPELLFSSSRLLSGRFRDPLVGRDVLVGILVGVTMVLVNEVGYMLPNWLDCPGMTPWAPDSNAMLSVAGLASRLVVACLTVLDVLGFLTLLVVSVVILRRRWLAIGLTGLVLFAANLTGANYAVEIPVVLVVNGLALLASVRFGILTFTVINAVVGLGFTPLTLDLARWYAARDLAFVALIFALAVWAFFTALGKKSPFGGMRLEDA
jgi:serine/threonine-protein kinase